METVIFDVMCRDIFIMQYKYKHCSLFAIDIEEVINEVVAKRPSLRSKRKYLKAFPTKEIVI